MPFRPTAAVIVSSALLLLTACGGSGSSSSSSAAAAPTTSLSVPADIATKPVVDVPSGPPPTALVETDLVVGTGPAAKAGDNLIVQYVGVAYDTKQQFDASWDDGPNGGPQPLPFQLGVGQVIKGWDQGIVGMRVGGRRELIIPPDLAYGAAGQGQIKPNETLVFVVDLLKIVGS
jgi:peptidylprolyl isomerase